MNAAPDTPPAGPDSMVCTGDWLARSTLIRPPSERTILTLDWNWTRWSFSSKPLR